MSVTKSIVSLLTGIALDQGLIGSIDDHVLDYFPDYKIKRWEKTIQKVTLKNLLTMTAPYKYKSEPWSKICVQDDWSIAALDFLGGRRGMTGEFQYSTLGIHILTGIITAVSQMTTTDYANQYLFKPLAITPRKLYVAPDGEAHKAFTVRKTPKGTIWFSDNKGVGAAGYGGSLMKTRAAMRRSAIAEMLFISIPKRNWLRRSPAISSRQCLTGSILSKNT